MDNKSCRAIYEGHEVSKKAGILDKHANYHWGHEEWAEKGVLLLNAALTIPHTKDLGHNMKEHCDTWRPFLVELFDTWIADPQYWQQQQHQQSQAQLLQKQQHQQQQHSKLPMMLWGYKGTYKNFALEVRNKFSYTARDSLKPITQMCQGIIVITSLKRQLNFLRGDIPAQAFATNTVCPHYDLEKFLNDYGVQNGWRKLIIGND